MLFMKQETKIEAINQITNVFLFLISDTTAFLLCLEGCHCQGFQVEPIYCHSYNSPGNYPIYLIFEQTL